MSDGLTAEAIRAGLRTRWLGRTLHLLDTTDSTNAVAARLAQQGAASGTLVLAEQQTAGKGRLGRTWFSPPGEGLYLSVVLRSEAIGVKGDRLPWIPLVSAMAVARAIIDLTGLQVRLKWPNDVVLLHRKVGGVLCETGGLGSAPAGAGNVIIGIGLNVNTPTEGFPEELRSLATSLASEIGRSVGRTTLLTTVLNELEPALETVGSVPASDLVRSYTNLCTTVGRRVTVHLGNDQTLVGWAHSVGADGSLHVMREAPQSGSLIEVRAGDVVHVR